MDNTSVAVEAAHESKAAARQPEMARCMETSPDNQLMLQVKDGDLDKLGPLFERYKMPLYRYLYLKTRDGAASEDLVQNVFERIIRYRERFRPEGEFKSWIFGIAHNLAVDFLRKRSRNRQLDRERGEENIDRKTAEDVILHEERIALLDEAMQRLREDYREVLILSRYQDLKYREIGDILGCSEIAVKVRIHRALKELKKLYHELE
jgi:RNA polymerase sigma-70 factor (ECF subfamily)